MNWKYIYRNAKWWFLYRTFHKYNKVHVRCDELKAGYYDIDTRMFYACFGLLKDYVELECAIAHVKLYQYPLPFPYNIPLVRWVKPFRSAADGLSYLTELSIQRWQRDWCKGEYTYRAGEFTPDALQCQTIIELYHWYVGERELRMDPLEASGFSRLRAGVSLEAQQNAAIRKDEIEEKYYQEDNEMLKKLIGVRSRLWTSSHI